MMFIFIIYIFVIGAWILCLLRLHYMGLFNPRGDAGICGALTKGWFGFVASEWNMLLSSLALFPLFI